MLTNKSPYFESRLKDCWTDGDADTALLLEHIDADAFEGIVEWMYNSRIPHCIIQEELNTLPRYHDEEWAHEEEVTASHSYGLLFHIHKTADELLMHELQNELIDWAIQDCIKTETWYTLDSVRSCHNVGLTHTPFDRMVLYACITLYMDKATGVPKSWPNEIQVLTDYPVAMADLMSMMADRYHKEEWVELKDIDHCVFHIHPAGKPNRCQAADELDSDQE